MRKLIADTLALLIFSTAAGLLVEVLVACQFNASEDHRHPDYSLDRQAIWYLPRLALRITGSDEAGLVRQTITDIVAFVTFQMPIYAAILFPAGATPPADCHRMRQCGRGFGDLRPPLWSLSGILPSYDASRVNFKLKHSQRFASSMSER